MIETASVPLHAHSLPNIVGQRQNNVV